MQGEKSQKIDSVNTEPEELKVEEIKFEIKDETMGTRQAPESESPIKEERNKMEIPLPVFTLMEGLL